MVFNFSIYVSAFWTSVTVSETVSQLQAYKSNKPSRKTKKKKNLVYKISEKQTITESLLHYFSVGNLGGRLNYQSKNVGCYQNNDDEGYGFKNPWARGMKVYWQRRQR